MLRGWLGGYPAGVNRPLVEPRRGAAAVRKLKGEGAGRRLAREGVIVTWFVWLIGSVGHR